MLNLRRCLAFILLSPSLLNMVAMAQTGAAATPPQSGNKAAAPQQSIGDRIAADKEKLDINTATPAQLKALPGITDVYAKRIIDGRPYTAKNQLVQRGVLPQAAYDKVKEGIIAHRPKPQ